jgi:hypothetical protein
MTTSRQLKDLLAEIDIADRQDTLENISRIVDKVSKKEMKPRDAIKEIGFLVQEFVN